MTPESAQEQIWSHFQNPESAYVFKASHPRHAFILRTIRRLAGSSVPTLLNVGIGDGNLERTAYKLGWSVSSLDPDAEAVKRLIEQGIAAKTGFLDAIPFPDNHFDFIVASEVLEHLAQRERREGLNEIRRTLKAGGYFIGTVPYQENLDLNVVICPKCRHVFHRWGHTTAFNLANIREELSPHFSLVTCRRTAFVEFKGRSFAGKLKSLARLVLAKCGAAIAVPSILFVVTKQSPDAASQMGTSRVTPQ